MYIWDLENTLTNSEHRQKWATEKNWDEFHAHFSKDQTRPGNVQLFNACKQSGTAIIVTGMMMKHRAMATNWLNAHNICPSLLIMRPDDNFLPSPEYKLAVVEQLQTRPWMIFDDRADVVMHFLAHGYPAIMVTQ